MTQEKNDSNKQVIEFKIKTSGNQKFGIAIKGIVSFQLLKEALTALERVIRDQSKEQDNLILTISEGDNLIVINDVTTKMHYYEDMKM